MTPELQADEAVGNLERIVAKARPLSRVWVGTDNLRALLASHTTLDTERQHEMALIRELTDRAEAAEAQLATARRALASAGGALDRALEHLSEGGAKVAAAYAEILPISREVDALLAEKEPGT